MISRGDGSAEQTAENLSTTSGISKGPAPNETCPHVKSLDRPARVESNYRTDRESRRIFRDIQAANGESDDPKASSLDSDSR